LARWRVLGDKGTFLSYSTEISLCVSFASRVVHAGVGKMVYFFIEEYLFDIMQMLSGETARSKLPFEHHFMGGEANR
jgi:hypothetical protein